MRLAHALVLAALLGSGAAHAHHSYAGFDQSDTAVHGTIEALAIENPHILIHVRTTDAERVTVVWFAVNASVRAGFPLEGPGSLKERIRVGDSVTVAGRMKRDQSGIQMLPTRIQHKDDTVLWSRPGR